MMLPTLDSLPLENKRVIIRFDGDVPVEGGKIQDDYRLKAVIPTIRACVERHAQVVLIAHRGRPKLPHQDETLSNRILADYFVAALGTPVTFLKDVPRSLPDDPIVLLENLRFSKDEEANSVAFAKQYAALGDVYINDAFAVSHRAHASVAALPQLLPHAAGMRFTEEVRQLEPLREHADEPYIVVLGGAKASDKSPIIRDLISRIDGIVIGGLVAVTYLAAMGCPTGAHEIDPEQVKLAQECIRQMNESGVDFYLPKDIVTQDGKVKPISLMSNTDLMLDIGPATQQCYTQAIDRANTVFWNGAMGKFEDPKFAAGTIAVARAIAVSGAEVRIASGGDTVSAIHQAKMEKAFTFISTGGGATLEFIAGRDLPGVMVLQKNK